MKKNIGKKDRITRLMMAIALLAIAAYKMSFVVFALGLFVLFESAFSWCIFYQFLGKSSCPISTKK